MRSIHIRSGQGFTLVEMTLVIAVIGIIAAMVAIFIRQPVQGYVASEARAELADAADIALRRMARELRSALPGSIRIQTDSGRQYIEFLPTKSGGRYLDAASAKLDGSGNAVGNVLDFANGTALNFDVVGPPNPAGLGVIAAGDLIVVNNQGVAPIDVYNCYGSATNCNVASVNSTSVANGVFTIVLDANPYASQTPKSPSARSRFQVVTTPVTYVCDPVAHTLTRYGGYAISAAQPTIPIAGASSALLAQGVAACAFSRFSVSGNAERGELVGISLTLQATQGDGGTVALFHQVHVDNTP